MDRHRRHPASHRYAAIALAVGIGLAGQVTPALGQTDYYNTDAARPVRVEDAFPVERYAFEAQVAPLRLERRSGGGYHWEVEPELAYGLLPRTHVEVGLPLLFPDGGAEEERFGVGGIDLSLFHNLNAETRTLPALAVAAEAVLPVGRHAPDRLYPSIKAIATRTFRLARIHVNGAYTVGSTPDAAAEVGETARWMAGLAVDRALPLSAALVIADVFLEEPLHAGAELAWTAELGTRYQLNPFFALDAGVGRRFTGAHQGWFITFGAARVFALRALMPGGAR